MANQASISVLIPAYGECPHLAEILEALNSGSLAPDEVIISHSGQNNPEEALRKSFPEVYFLHSNERLFAGAARNRAARMAKSEILAFCDSDTVPAKDWLAMISASLTSQNRRVVVGSVGVRRSGGYWGMANWLLEFSEMAPWRASGFQTGGASCNMAVKAEHFREVGGFPDALRGGEDTILLANLRSRGLEQYFEPSAMVRHYNHSGLTRFARHQLGLGKGFAEVRARKSMKGSSVARFPLLALLVFVPKAFVVLRRTLPAGLKPFLLGLVLTPGVLIGSVIWSWGCFTRARELRRQRVAASMRG